MVVIPWPVRLSVVAPAHNEQDNLERLVGEIETALEPLGVPFEMIIVDDGSSDRTPEILHALTPDHKRLRVLRLRSTQPGIPSGQSAAFRAGFHAARGEWIVTLDADRQNDPADIPAMLQHQDRTGADMIQGDRSHNRQDSFVRRFSSWVGCITRRALLGDTITDTGCSLRLMRRELALALPLQYRGMHRFIPFTARQLGYRVVEVAVSHRPRMGGRTKYGTWDRAFTGLYDCVAVRWMAGRRCPVDYDVVEPSTSDVHSSSDIPGAVGRRA